MDDFCDQLIEQYNFTPRIRRVHLAMGTLVKRSTATNELDMMPWDLCSGILARMGDHDTKRCLSFEVRYEPCEFEPREIKMLYKL